MDDNSKGCLTGGSVIACILSAALNHSFLWGVFHFLCSWLYVLYVVCFRTKEIVPALRNMFGV
jgi:hypothetical protein